MKIRLSQHFFVLSQPKLSVHLKILFSLMFFKEAIVILSFIYFFWRNTPTYLPTYLVSGNEAVFTIKGTVWKLNKYLQIFAYVRLRV